MTQEEYFDSRLEKETAKITELTAIKQNLSDIKMQYNNTKHNIYRCKNGINCLKRQLNNET